MTEITAQPQGSSKVGMLAVVAKPPDGEFARRLSQVQSDASPPTQDATSRAAQQGKVATTQPNADSQNPDPQKASFDQNSTTDTLLTVAATPAASNLPSPLITNLEGSPSASDALSMLKQDRSTSGATVSLLAQNAGQSVLPTPNRGSTTGDKSSVVSTIVEAATDSKRKSVQSATQTASILTLVTTTADKPATPPVSKGSSSKSSPSTTSRVASQAASNRKTQPAEKPTAASLLPSPGDAAQTLAASLSLGDSGIPVSTPPNTKSSIQAKDAPRVSDNASANLSQTLLGLGQTGVAVAVQVISPRNFASGSSQSPEAVAPQNSAAVDPNTPTTKTNDSSPNIGLESSLTGASSSTVDINTLKESFPDIVKASSFRDKVSGTPVNTVQSGVQADPKLLVASRPPTAPSEVSTDAPSSNSIRDVILGDTKSLSPKVGGENVQSSLTSPSTQSTSSGQISGSSAAPPDKNSSGDSHSDNASLLAPPIELKTKAATESKESDALAAQTVTQPQRSTTASPVTQTSTVSTSHIDTPKLVNQVADRIQLLAITQQKDGVVVHLEPANLGTITLIVKSVGSNVTAQVMASDDHVRSALDQSQDQLGAQLQSRGYHLTSVSVGSASPTSGSGSSSSDNSKNNASGTSLWQGSQQQAQQHQQARASSTIASRTATLSETDTKSIRTSSSTSMGLDVWI